MTKHDTRSDQGWPLTGFLVYWMFASPQRYWHDRFSSPDSGMCPGTLYATNLSVYDGCGMTQVRPSAPQKRNQNTIPVAGAPAGTVGVRIGGSSFFSIGVTILIFTGNTVYTKY